MGNKQAEVKALLAQFETDLEPVETGDALRLFTDNCTGAQYCECHVQASKIVAFGTVDAPLDPEEQPAFRANREILGNQPAFLQMKDDARRRRSFSNIVAEYTSAFDAGTPLKVIGGQHRFAAIETALDDGVDELHGLKVYFGLTKEQRIDVQLISNTNLAINGALVDRLRETFRGPALRDWCHDVGLLKPDLDFGDKPAAGGPITVHLARTFIANFYRGWSCPYLTGQSATEFVP